MEIKIRTERGSVTLFSISLLTVFVGTALSLFTLMKHWRAEIATQLSLDRCVQKYALDAKNLIEDLESSNRKIKATRASIVVSTPLAPELLPALQLALDGLKIYQELKIIQWREKQFGWLVRVGCNLTIDISKPFPSLPYTQLPPDALGATPLEETPLMRTYEEKGMQLYLRQGHRYSAAKILANKQTLFRSWQALWAGNY